MINRKLFHPGEKGQSLVIIALGMVAFLAMLMLVLDGGNAYLMRRQAQTAADSAALAGAEALCDDQAWTDPISIGLDYVEYNGADRGNSVVNVVSSSKVEATARIHFNTFFGGFFNIPDATAEAYARAGCFMPRSGQILPLAYACLDEGLMTGEGEDPDKFCVRDFVEQGTAPEDVPLGQKYIIWSSTSVDDEIEDACIDSEGNGTIDCDVDDDGENELMVGGNRAWLDLSGQASDAGNGSAELCDWIENGFNRGIRIHTWYAGQPGVSNSILDCVATVLNEPALVPIFDAISYGQPTLPYHIDHTECSGIDYPCDIIVLSNGTSTTYYHVISFSIFVPTCVKKTGNADCPLYQAFRDMGSLRPQDKTIEGYFMRGYVTGVEGRGDDFGLFDHFGVYTIYLDR